MSPRLQIWGLGAAGILFIAGMVWTGLNERPGPNPQRALAIAQIDDVRRGVGLDSIFGGRCTQDCEGHRAGYLWAVDNLPTFDECEEVESASFRDGCRTGRDAIRYVD